MRVIGFVAAKLTSKRMEAKNLRTILGTKTLLECSIDYLLNSKYIEEVYVSGMKEDYEKLSILFYKEDGVRVMVRDNEDPDCWLIDVYRDGLCEMGDFDYLVSTTCDNPLKYVDLDGAIELAVNSYLNHVFTTSMETGKRTGALDIMAYDVIRYKSFTGNMAGLPWPELDIHTEKDLEKARSYFLYLKERSSHACMRGLEKDFDNNGIII